VRYNDILLKELIDLCITFNRDKSRNYYAAETLTGSLKDILKMHDYYFKNKLHEIVKVFITKVTDNNNNNNKSDHFVSISKLQLFLMLIVEITRKDKIEKLLQLLNSMTTENMKKLLKLLNSMTPQNMQKLLQLLKDMTTKTMADLLDVLTHDNNKDEITTTILDDYIKLDAESMAQLLELYSFIKKKKYTSVRDPPKYWIHRYKNGNTPLSQRLFRNTKHKPTTCKSVQSLDKTANQLKTRDGIEFIQDEEFTKVLKECEHYPPQIVTGGGRRRKTLKKKQRHVNKR
jgi:hypothetical protein